MTFEIGKDATVQLGRWSWIGHGTKIRAHEGEVEIGAKTVIGQECTISSFQHVSIGRECIVADRVMLIDFDHGVVEVERPIRLQGIYKRDVRVGNNCWIGYGACFLRGVTVGDNCIVGTNTVVTKDVPDERRRRRRARQGAARARAPKRHAVAREPRARSSPRSSASSPAATRAGRSARATPPARWRREDCRPLMDPVRDTARELVAARRARGHAARDVVDLDRARGADPPATPACGH